MCCWRCVMLCWRGQSGDETLSQLDAWNNIKSICACHTGHFSSYEKYTLRHARKTHQIFADFDWILKHSPNHSLIASRGCQGPKVAIILGAIHSNQEIIQGNSSCNLSTLAWGQKHNFWRDCSWRTIVIPNHYVKFSSRKSLKHRLTVFCDFSQVGGQCAPACRLASSVTFHFLKSAHIVLIRLFFLLPMLHTRELWH